MNRNHQIDNAKFLMMFLVVVGHFMEPLIDQNSVIKSLWMCIYSFHMPLFVMISGLFAKMAGISQAIRDARKSVLVPFLVFTLAYELLNLALTGEISSYSRGLQPYWILWFLYSLFIWRLLFPVIARFRYPLMLSVAIALVAGSVDNIGYFLGLSRTLYFFPFFILGHKLAPQIRAGFRLELMHKVLIASVMVLNLTMFVMFPDISANWLYGSFSYARLGVNDQFGMLARLSLYGLSTASAITVLMLIPNTGTNISTRGSNTLCVYLWHGLVVKIASAFGLIALIGQLQTAYSLVVITLTSLILVLFLSTNSTAAFTQRYVFDPVDRCLPRAGKKE